MQKLMLVVIGLIPLPLGYIINHLAMTTYFDRVLPYGLISLVFLGAWFCVGMLTYHFAESDRKTLALAHLFGFVAMFLNSFQEIVNKRYWPNQIGIATQFFYLPLINLAARVPLFSHRLYTMSIVSFGFMCAAFYSGRLTRRRLLWRS